MSPELQAVIMAFIGIGGGAFGAFLSYRLNIRKTTAETASIIEKISGNLLKRLEERVETLESKLEIAERELELAEKSSSKKQDKIDALEKRVVSLEAILAAKDEKISGLMKQNIDKDVKIMSLERRVAELESELSILKQASNGGST